MGLNEADLASGTSILLEICFLFRRFCIFFLNMSGYAKMVIFSTTNDFIRTGGFLCFQTLHCWTFANLRRSLLQLYRMVLVAVSLNRTFGKQLFTNTISLSWLCSAGVDKSLIFVTTTRYALPLSLASNPVNFYLFKLLKMTVYVVLRTDIVFLIRLIIFASLHT